MPARLPSPEEDLVPRKRKAHTKSRQGCGNCKLRRVKCDEAKPSCKKCKDYGVTCSYDRQSTEMQLSFGEVAALRVTRLPSPVSVSTNETILGILNNSLNVGAGRGPDDHHPVWKLDLQDLATLGRFLSRTMYTIGSGRTREVYKREAFPLACSHPFLMHIVLTITLMHDRHLAGPPHPRPGLAELTHGYKGTALFSSALRGPLTSIEKDAIWVTGALIGACNIASFDAASPHEAWPLKSTSDADLRWIRLSDGKKEVWRIADPTRPDSCLRELADLSMDDQAFTTALTDRQAIDRLSPELVSLLGLGSSAVPDEDLAAINPYWTGAAVLGRLADVEANENSVMKYLSFLSQMTLRFRELLEVKEPRALLMMAYWYAKIAPFTEWWVFRRSVVECRAACLYLERYHANLPGMRKLLEFPKGMVGGFDV